MILLTCLLLALAFLFVLIWPVLKWTLILALIFTVLGIAWGLIQFLCK